MGIEDGMVYVATQYHKGYAIGGNVKIIHRYLPREVGELVVWYLWMVLPFQQRLDLVRNEATQGEGFDSEYYTVAVKFSVALKLSRVAL
jgi:hypothetical protein